MLADMEKHHTLEGENVDQSTEFLTRFLEKHKNWHFNTLHLVVVLNTTSYFKTFYSQCVFLIAHQAVFLATVCSLMTPATEPALFSMRFKLNFPFVLGFKTFLTVNGPVSTERSRCNFYGVT